MDSADIVIVGGGCMGAATAYYLTQQGVGSVVLIERDTQLGTGSTGRNAGGVRHQFSDPANIALSRESIALFERFEAVVGSPIDFWQDGYLFLLSSEASAARFRESVALQRSLGLEVDWLTGDEAARMAPGLDATGVVAATFCAKDGITDPNGVTMGFAKAAQARGLTILRDTLMAGITTVRDLGTEGAGYADIGLKKSIDDGIIPGPRMLVSGPAMVATGTYGPKGFAPEMTVPQGAEEADGIEGVTRVARRQIGHGIDFVKIYADYRWGPNGEARATFSIEEIAAIVAVAKSSGRYVAAHAGTAEGMRRAVLGLSLIHI